jgi:adenylate cyclase, class 2
MSAKREIEVKFKVDDPQVLIERLQTLGFSQITGHTHEMNVLYDFPGGPLRRRGALLRVRQYGSKWTVTYKDRNTVRPGRHKSRREIETVIHDGQALATILQSVGFQPSFAYEKFRSEWSDATGHVVLDETPIGNFGEIEGPPRWIDQVASQLGISKNQYITSSYAELFQAWKRKTGSKSNQMLFPGRTRNTKAHFQG